MTDMTCTGCRQVITGDPSGLCEDCQADVLSQRPGSVTDEQRYAICGLMADIGLWRRTSRDEVISSVVADWTHAGDLGWLSQQRAGDVLEYLEERRLSRETRGL
jgi:hypothetical protein